MVIIPNDAFFFAQIVQSRLNLLSLDSLRGLLLLLCFVPNLSKAEPKEAESKTFIALGAGAIYTPKFSGSDEYRTRAIPVVSINYGDFSFGGLGGLSYQAFNDDGLKAGLSLGYFGGRNQSEADYLKGMGDLDEGLNFGPYIRKQMGPFAVSAAVKQDVSTNVGGLTAGASLGFTYPLAKSLMINTNIKASWMDGKHAQAYYGVTQRQSLDSGLSSNNVQAGFEKGSLSIMLLYFFMPQWTLTSLVSKSLLLNEAKSSPITRESEPIMLMTSVSYKF